MVKSFTGGVSQVAYHTIPTDLDLITTSPTMEGIFKYLAQIGFDKFHEFIADILEKIEGHTNVEITNGPGDEKQDILSISASGERCLTQCKHTEDPSTNYNGDELDIMVTACLRKNCKKAIFVTNSDLTPQAKRYVNDNEYSRGWSDPAMAPTVEYWNGDKIWEKIKNNSDILNKWFSGLGQVHGLRSFKFHVTIQKMPYEKGEITKSSEIIEVLIAKGLIKKDKLSENYFAELRKGLSIKVSKWFQQPSELDIKYMPPGGYKNFLLDALYALTIEVFIDNALQKYVPTAVKKEVVKYLFMNSLPTVSADKWWHFTLSQGRSFLYLHDVSEPREIQLDGALTMVKVNSGTITSEVEYCSLERAIFKPKFNEYGEESIWIHKPTGIEVIQLFEEELHPAYVYNFQLRQANKVSLYKTYSFKAIENIDASYIMRVRRMLDEKWIAFTFNETTLVWGIPPDTESSRVDYIESKLGVLGLQILLVRDEDRDNMLSQIKNDLPPTMELTHTDADNLAFPVRLEKRGFWLSRKINLKKDISEEQALALLWLKFEFENKYGYDNAHGKEQIKTHTSELSNMLFDLMSVRCSRMLDIAILNNPISVNLRIYDNEILSSSDLVVKYVLQFKELLEVINKIIEKS